MEDINYTPSHNFRAMFADAKAIKNIDRMSEVFNMLASEVGLEDPVAQSAAAAIGKLAAEMANGKGKGPEAKKL
jgi:hypothetical protein